MGIDFKRLYDELSSKILEKYDLFHLCFEDIVRGGVSLEKIGIDKKIADILTECVKERMKPAEVFVEVELKLKSYSPDVVELIKGALNMVLHKDSVSVLYGGGGAYRIRAKADNYKEAERILDKSTHNIISFMEKNGGEGEFVKSE